MSKPEWFVVATRYFPDGMIYNKWSPMRGVDMTGRSYSGVLKFFSAVCVMAALLMTAAWSVPAAHAQVYSYNSSKTVVGLVRIYRVKPGESLIEIARRFDLGYNEIADANPGIDPFVPGNGVRVTVPTSWVLPDTEYHSGIVINLSELRLYYYFMTKGVRYVRTFPVGIGREGDLTPTGTFKVMEKIVGPAWHVPESIRKEEPGLPKVVPAGPDNPLGSHAMRLSLPTILVHGTNKPWGVGRSVSHGCIRLYPKDIPKLFAMVPVGTSVEIVRQPVKAGPRDGRVYVEIHKDNSGEHEDYFQVAVRILQRKGLLTRISTRKLYQAVEGQRGIPVDITE